MSSGRSLPRNKSSIPYPKLSITGGGGVVKGRGFESPVGDLNRPPLNSPVLGISAYIDQVVSDNLDDSNFSDHFPTLKRRIVLPNEKIDHWGLPGHGESKETCGTFFMKGCLETELHPGINMAYFEPHVHKCYSPTCPVCWLFWCKRASLRISDRIKSYLSIHKKLKPIHVVASVPKSCYHFPVSKMRKKAQTYVKKGGFWGGSCIFHPFRQDKDSGIWYFSPHFHFIGVGWIHGAETIYSKTGWIVKNIRVRKSLFGTAFYQLTHAGIWYGEGKRHTVTWLGCMSYNKMRMKPFSRPRKSCPYCASHIGPLLYIGEGDPPLPCGSGYLASAEGWFALSFSPRLPPGWKDLFGKLSLYTVNPDPLEAFV